MVGVRIEDLVIPKVKLRPLGVVKDIKKNIPKWKKNKGG
jgi:hypothetical protein